MYIILHNIRSNYNVGSLFRTADAAGVKKVFLVGYTPAPVDRFGRINNELAKTALGAEKTVSWERAKSAEALFARLKKEKVSLVAVEQSPRSIDYKKIPHKKNLALIFGNEVRGLSPSILKHCDCIAEIPMRGRMVRHAHHPRKTRAGKESLNVSVAAGIVLFSR